VGFSTAGAASQFLPGRIAAKLRPVTEQIAAVLMGAATQASALAVLPIFFAEGFFFLLINTDLLMVGHITDQQHVAIYFATAISMLLEAVLLSNAVHRTMQITTLILFPRQHIQHARSYSSEETS
jgi:hypothetical protein